MAIYRNVRMKSAKNENIMRGFKKDSIYKIRNHACFTSVDNHTTYPFLYSTFLTISKTEFPKSIRLLVKEWDMYH